MGLILYAFSIMIYPCSTENWKTLIGLVRQIPPNFYNKNAVANFWKF